MALLSLPLKKTDDDFVPWPYLDTLYDYTRFLQNPIGSMPLNKIGSKVAIIGAGAAGLCAAHELIKVGIIPVIFEASQRYGGRLWSQPFLDNQKQPLSAFAEMGAMRFPQSAKTLYHYFSQFNMGFTPFPDPGKVPTRLFYENVSYDWQAGTTTPPGPFGQIQQEWNAFFQQFEDKIYTPWKNGDMQGVIKAWQELITAYKNTSIFAAVQQGTGWDPSQMNAFGALGVGSGGFGPLYQVDFVELLRIILNGWETDQQLLTNGISQLADNFYKTPVSTPWGMKSVEELSPIRFMQQVNNIAASPGNPALLSVQDKNSGNLYSEQYEAVIAATTTRSLEKMGLTLPTYQSGALDVPQKRALRNLHLMNSSKMFILTETKFWKNKPNMPQNIQTDEMPRGIYTLDYPQTAHGVVLISYTWGDDSTKLLALSPEERFGVLKDIIAQIHPEFAENLVPVNGEIYNVDWELEDNFFGAFKLNYPGQEPDIQAAYYQFLNVLDPSRDNGVYWAGDSISWSGGWTEGALHTGLNAATAAAKKLGASVQAFSPLSQNPSLYQY